MGLEKVIPTPRKRDVSAKVITDGKVRNAPSLKMMTKNEIENKRVQSYEFAI